MNALLDLFRVKKNLLTIFSLLILVLGIPLGISLIRNSQQFFSRAAGETISLTEGNCIKMLGTKKVAICTVIPLKLLNPFPITLASITASASPSPSAHPTSSPSPTVSPTAAASSSPSPAVSPSPSALVSPSPSSIAGSQTVRVNSWTNTAIQSALDSIKTTGGAVYLPAGIYQISSKIRVYANTTMFGDGIDQTILKATQGLVNSAEAMISNDSSRGLTNIIIRDMTLDGGLSAQADKIVGFDGIKFRDLVGGIIFKVKVQQFGDHGIWLSYKPTSASPGYKAVYDVRVSECQSLKNKGEGIRLDSGERNVIDHCVVNAQGDALGIGLEIGIDGKLSNNLVISNDVQHNGHGLTFTAGNFDNFSPGMVNSNNIICYNSVKNNLGPGVWDQRGRDNVYIGNIIASNNNNDGHNDVINVNSFGYEEKLPPATDNRCNIPAKYSIPSPPSKPQALKLDGLFESVFAYLHWPKFINRAYATAQMSTSPSPAVSPSAATSVTECSDNLDNDGDETLDKDDPQCHIDGKAENQNSYRAEIKYEFYAYRLADSEANLEKANWQIFSSTSSIDDQQQALTQNLIANFELIDKNPGPKQIWVEYRNPLDRKYKDHITFDLLEQAPEITGVDCTLDITKQNVKVSINGSHFGTKTGKSLINTSTSDVLMWTGKNITAMYKGGVSSETNQQYKVKIIRDDTLESQEELCRLDTSLLSLGARVFCREEGSLEASDVSVTIFATNLKDQAKLDKVEEKVTIDKNGIIQGLKTKLQSGKKYGISIKAPNTLRRNAIFTASEGTTIVTTSDGKPFILPIGDIAPLQLYDGKINSLDQSELVRQWKLSSTLDKSISADFNKDKRVNSIDWACMRYDFDATDDPLPQTLDATTSSNGQRSNNSGDDSLEIIFNSSSSPDASAQDRIYTSPPN